MSTFLGSNSVSFPCRRALVAESLTRGALGLRKMRSTRAHCEAIVSCQRPRNGSGHKLQPFLFFVFIFPPKKNTFHLLLHTSRAASKVGMLGRINSFQSAFSSRSLQHSLLSSTFLSSNFRAQSYCNHSDVPPNMGGSIHGEYECVRALLVFFPPWFFNPGNKPSKWRQLNLPGTRRVASCSWASAQRTGTGMASARCRSFSTACSACTASTASPGTP